MSFVVGDEVRISTNGYDWGEPPFKDSYVFFGATGRVKNIHQPVDGCPPVYEVSLNDKDLHRELGGDEFGLDTWPFYAVELEKLNA